MSYEEFARRVREGGILTDPWIDGEPRFRETPVVLSAASLRSLYGTAEDVCAVYNELTLLVADQPSLLDDFFALGPTQKTMWHASQPAWHGLARADVFLTDEGPCIAELNCDTPTGEAEAVVLGALAGAEDPNAHLGERFVAMLEAMARAELATCPPKLTVGLVYPTELTEDLSLVRLYGQWLEGRGHAVVLGSPYNLRATDGRLSLFGTPIDVVLRHYKTDWWCEREAVWTDDTVVDSAALTEPLTALFEALFAGTVCVVNPLGSVLPQNKRSMAFMWEHLHRFSPRAQSIIEAHVPYTARLETLHHEQLVAQKDAWVLKSDYGAEGDEVVVGRWVTDPAWKRALARAKPHQFVGQRFFDAHADEQGEILNYGVYLVGGEASGVYARAQKGVTDTGAKSVGVVVR